MPTFALNRQHVIFGEGIGRLFPDLPMLAVALPHTLDGEMGLCRLVCMILVLPIMLIAHAEESASHSPSCTL